MNWEGEAFINRGLLTLEVTSGDLDLHAVMV